MPRGPLCGYFKVLSPDEIEQRRIASVEKSKEEMEARAWYIRQEEEEKRKREEEKLKAKQEKALEKARRKQEEEARRRGVKRKPFNFEEVRCRTALQGCSG